MPVSLEMAARLKEAGWTRDVIHHYLQFPNEDWTEWEGIHYGEHLNWLPRPMLEEILEELNWMDLTDYWMTNHYGLLSLSKWLNDTLRSADAAAEVWINLKGRKNGKE